MDSRQFVSCHFLDQILLNFKGKVMPMNLLEASAANFLQSQHFCFFTYVEILREVWYLELIVIRRYFVLSFRVSTKVQIPQIWGGTDMRKRKRSFSDMGECYMHASFPKWNIVRLFIQSYRLTIPSVAFSFFCLHFQNVSPSFFI